MPDIRIGPTSEIFQVACHRDAKGVYHPLPDCISRTTAGAARKAHARWRSPQHKHKPHNIIVMPFRLEFIPAWIEEDEPEPTHKATIIDLEKQRR